MTQVFSLHDRATGRILGPDLQLRGQQHFWTVHRDMLQSMSTKMYLTEQNQLSSALDASEVDVMVHPTLGHALIRSRVSGAYLGSSGWSWDPHMWGIQFPNRR
jgi:hypothetical protein